MDLRASVLLAAILCSLGCGRLSFAPQQLVDQDASARGDASQSALDATVVDGAPPMQDARPGDELVPPSDGQSPGCGNTCGAGGQCSAMCVGRCTCSGGCNCDLTCPTGDPCTAECSGNNTACRLQSTSNDTVALRCEEGASCSFVASGAGMATVTCDLSASCDVTCGGTERCSVSCGGGSCVLRCGSMASCSFSNCMNPRSCGAGLQVCGRACP